MSRLVSFLMEEHKRINRKQIAQCLGQHLSHKSHLIKFAVQDDRWMDGTLERDEPL